MDLLQQLSEEHVDLRIHLERIQAAAEMSTTAEITAALLAAQDALGRHLDDHIRQEEAHVFAGADEVLGEELVRLFREEHQEVRRLRDTVFTQLMRGEIHRDAVLRLCDLILDHQQREDLMLFPCARTAPGMRLLRQN